LENLNSTRTTLQVYILLKIVARFAVLNPVEAL